jgi:hypothetical protein
MLLYGLLGCLRASTPTNCEHHCAHQRPSPRSLLLSRALEVEEQQLLGKVPPQPNRLAQVQRWLAERRDALSAEHDVIDAQQLVSMSVSFMYGLRTN